jgi:hypothetical protein
LLATLPAGPAGGAAALPAGRIAVRNQRHADATVEYETVAYRAAGAARAADAGYSALLAYAALEKAATDRAPLQRQAAESALRFAAAFGSDPRAGTVLANAAQQLDALGEGPRAATVARQALALQPPAPAEARRVAWVVIAHQAFDGKTQAQAEEAERAYGEVLALTPEGAAGREAFVQRQAAAIYRQGELAREAEPHARRRRPLRAGGQPAAAGRHQHAARQCAVRPRGRADRAEGLGGRRAGAGRLPPPARRPHPAGRGAGQAGPGLPGTGPRHGRRRPNWSVVASSTQDPTLARGALWQAAELHQQAARDAAPKSAALATATRAWERYLQQYPQPVEPAVLGALATGTLARQDNQAAKATAWLRAVQQADHKAAKRAHRARAAWAARRRCNWPHRCWPPTSRCH